MESRSNPEEELALSVFVNFQLFMHTAQLDLYTVSGYCLIKLFPRLLYDLCTGRLMTV